MNQNQQMPKRIAVFGECMLEISLPPLSSSLSSVAANFAFGGDTLNMSVYMARLGAQVDYVTAIGDDKSSEWLLQRWAAEGVGCTHVIRNKGQQPGMYMIELDQYGERSFKYWRKNSPASAILDDPKQASAVFKALSTYDIIFLSGISLAILKPKAREALLEFLTDYRTRGGKVAFDCNHRPNLWADTDEAIEYYDKVYRITDIALPTFEDEQAVFGYQTPDEALQALAAKGVVEIILKMGEKGCYYTHQGEFGLVPVQAVQVVDTTSAGDSFNAGYLARRLSGASVQDSCKAGHRIASIVVQHRGAIIPINMMPNSDSADGA